MNAGDKKSVGEVSSLGGFDWWLFTIMLVILSIGLIMVLSASGIVAEQVNGDKYHFFKRQLLFACMGGVALWGAALLPRNWLYKMQYPALFLALALLLVTLSPLAPSINGAKRWIPLGFFSVQPMEFVKIALALYLAYFMSAKQDIIKTFSRGVIPPFAVTGVFCFLLLLQPDFGSAVVLASLLFFMCIAGGTRFIYLFFSLALAVAGAIALAISSPYRMRRLLAFLDPFQDAHNTGYQLVQSLLAIGSGGFFGVGIGASKQKMFYLPEAHNDFIMAVLSEELGFVGVSVVMILFALLFWRCYKIIMRQRILRDRLTAFGITVILAMGAVMNLAVVMGVAPPKGVPMPLMSYGGSNLLATMLCVGLLMNFSRTADAT
ncbi:MAG: putative lipid II flippase FtsW [Desulfovibrio sp.]|nr:putative lipid II flippase FtsW [Desulfovibrio sp.]